MNTPPAKKFGGFLDAIATGVVRPRPAEWNMSPHERFTLVLPIGLGFLFAAFLILRRSNPRTFQINATVCWVACLVTGLSILFFSTYLYDAEDQAALDASMAELENMMGKDSIVSSDPEPAMTDRGSPITLWHVTNPRSPESLRRIEDAYLHKSDAANYVIHREGCNDRSNCHGWVFTGGRAVINATDVETILLENEYREMVAPEPDDLAIYRRNGCIVHSAIVRYVSGSMPILVEGKWDAIGVYLHPVDKSPYGKQVAFFRSPRQGHLLAAQVAPGR